MRSIKTALITGSTSRIGKSIAHKLAYLGYNILLHYNQSRDAALELCKKLRRLYGVRAESMHLDFSADGQLNNFDLFISKVKMTSIKNISVIINNASLFKASAEGEIQDIYRVNFKTPRLLIERLHECCFFNKDNANIINIYDALMFKNSKKTNKYYDYFLSKKKLFEYSQKNAARYAPYYRINGIAPGIVAPTKTGGAIEGDASYFKKVNQHHLLDCQVSPSDVAKAAEYILKSHFLINNCIYVDGGAHIERQEYFI